MNMSLFVQVGIPLLLATILSFYELDRVYLKLAAMAAAISMIGGCVLLLVSDSPSSPEAKLLFIAASTTCCLLCRGNGGSAWRGMMILPTIIVMTICLVKALSLSPLANILQ